MLIFVYLGEFWRLLNETNHSEHTTEQLVLVSTRYYDEGITNKATIEADFREVSNRLLQQNW
jgi:hypothetical protein